MKIKIKSRSTASRLKPVPQGVRGVLFSGTGFSREEASVDAGIFADRTHCLWERACSRMLLIVPTLRVGMQPVTLRVALSEALSDYFNRAMLMASTRTPSRMA